MRNNTCKHSNNINFESEITKTHFNWTLKLINLKLILLIHLKKHVTQQKLLHFWVKCTIDNCYTNGAINYLYKKDGGNFIFTWHFFLSSKYERQEKNIGIKSRLFLSQLSCRTRKCRCQTKAHLEEKRYLSFSRFVLIRQRCVFKFILGFYLVNN